MAESAKIECLGAEGEVSAYLHIAAGEQSKQELERKIPEPLLELEVETAERQGEYPVQLRENATYQCHIEGAGPYTGSKLQLEDNPLFDKSLFKSKGIYLLRTRSTAGSLSFRIIDEEGGVAGRALVEVRSLKLNYREEFRGMVCGIAQKARDLLFQLGAASEMSLVSNWSEDVPTIQQQVEFLRGILYGGDLWKALDRIIRMPHERLITEPEIRPISRIGKADSQIAKQLASRHPRVSLPDGHPLKNRMQSVPLTVSISSRSRTIDTPENRFIKHALKDFMNFLQHAESLIEKADRKKYEPVLKDCQRLRTQLSQRLSAGLFKSLGEPRILPLGSPVLQRKSGYREVYQAWLGFRASSLLKWEGAEDAFGGGQSSYQAGKKDLPALYEAWLFFQLLDVFRRKFKVDESDIRKFFKTKGDLGEFTLKQGTTCSFSGHEENGLGLSGRLQYNRSFKYSGVWGEAGSWTRVLRPDYTMSFWPTGMKLDEAEARELAVHIHFDAKYRVHSVGDLFGKVDGDLDDEEVTREKRDEKDGNYNRADLLKMHAYRDAIRRSEGAYVLYPGTITDVSKDNKNWQGFHELLPGLGAFAIRPTFNGEAEGIEHVSQFIDEAVVLLANRASRLSHFRYGGHHIHLANTMESYRVKETGAIYKANRVLKELEEVGFPAQETIVLCGFVKNEAHLNWIRDKGRYNFRMEPGSGYLPALVPEFAMAKLIVLRDTNEIPYPGLWQITRQVDEIPRARLRDEFNYPDPRHSHYAVFQIEPMGSQDEFNWDPVAIERLRKSFQKHPDNHGEPFKLTLNQLITALV